MLHDAPLPPADPYLAATWISAASNRRRPDEQVSVEERSSTLTCFGPMTMTPDLPTPALAPERRNAPQRYPREQPVADW